MIQFTVHVLTPPSGPANSLHARGGGDSAPRRGLPQRTMAVAADPGESLSALFEKVKEIFESNYDERETKPAWISCMRTGRGADINVRRGAVGQLFDRNMTAEQLTLTVERVWVDRESSIPDTSHLRPENHRKRRLEDLSPQQQADLKRRREEEERYGAEVADLDADTAVASREPPDARAQEADNEGDATRLDKDGFKIPTLKSKRKRKRAEKAAAGSQKSDRVADSQPEPQGHTARPQTAQEPFTHSSPSEAAAARSQTVGPRSGGQPPTRNKGRHAVLPTALHVDGETQCPNATPTSAQPPRSSDVSMVEGRPRRESDVGMHAVEPPSGITEQRPVEPPTDIAEQDPIVDDDDALLDGIHSDGFEGLEDDALDGLDDIHTGPPGTAGAGEVGQLALGIGGRARHSTQSNRTPSNSHESLNNSQAARTASVSSSLWSVREDRLVLYALRQNLSANSLISRYAVDRSGSAIRNRRAVLNRKYPGGVVETTDTLHMDGPEEPLSTVQSGSRSGTAAWTSAQETYVRDAIATGFDPEDVRNSHLRSRTLESVTKKFRRLEDTVVLTQKAHADYPQDTQPIRGWMHRHDLKLRRTFRENLTIHTAYARWFTAFPRPAFNGKVAAYRQQLLGTVHRGRVDRTPTESTQSRNQQGSQAMQPIRIASAIRSGITNDRNSSPTVVVNGQQQTRAIQPASAIRPAMNGDRAASPAVLVRRALVPPQASQLSRDSGTPGGQTTLNFQRQADHGLGRLQPADADADTVEQKLQISSQTATAPPNDAGQVLAFAGSSTRLLRSSGTQSEGSPETKPQVDPSQSSSAGLSSTNQSEKLSEREKLPRAEPVARFRLPRPTELQDPTTKDAETMALAEAQAQAQARLAETRTERRTRKAKQTRLLVSKLTLFHEMATPARERQRGTYPQIFSWSDDGKKAVVGREGFAVELPHWDLACIEDDLLWEDSVKTALQRYQDESDAVRIFGIRKSDAQCEVSEETGDKEMNILYRAKRRRMMRQLWEAKNFEIAWIDRNGGHDIVWTDEENALQSVYYNEAGEAMEEEREGLSELGWGDDGDDEGSHVTFSNSGSVVSYERRYREEHNITNTRHVSEASEGALPDIPVQEAETAQDLLSHIPGHEAGLTAQEARGSRGNEEISPPTPNLDFPAPGADPAAHESRSQSRYNEASLRGPNVELSGPGADPAALEPRSNHDHETSPPDPNATSSSQRKSSHAASDPNLQSNGAANRSRRSKRRAQGRRRARGDNQDETPTVGRRKEMPPPSALPQSTPAAPKPKWGARAQPSNSATDSTPIRRRRAAATTRVMGSGFRAHIPPMPSTAPEVLATGPPGRADNGASAFIAQFGASDAESMAGP